MRNIMKGISCTLLLSALVVVEAQASTINAASCSTSAVQAAINSAATGDTVYAPAGSCSWAGVTVNKSITLQGAGIGKTNITLSGDPSLTITKQASGIIRLKGFTFTASGRGSMSQPITIQGPWKAAQPVIIQDNRFDQSGNGLFHITVPGGMIFSNNVSNGGWDDGAFNIKISNTSESWTTADSLGMRDTNGTWNHYIENNTFYGHSNGIMDCDDNCRVVLRYNTLSYGGYNSHGKDSSPYGTRHFEIYNNTWLYPESNSQLANVNWIIWVRGGTGVIFNNAIPNVIGQAWGDKHEVRLNIRGAEDIRPQGTCSNVSYPVPNQLGQNHNGTSAFTDPIYIWGNTGNFRIFDGWGWGNPCGFNWSTFFQWGRDGVSTGTPKPGYTPYTYPHPLAASGAPLPPPTPLPAPTSLRVIL